MMNREKLKKVFFKYCATLFLTLTVFLSLIPNLSSTDVSANTKAAFSGMPSNSRAFTELEDLLNEINFTRIKNDVYFFFSLGSRVTGYPGFYKAAEYIIGELKRANLNVKVHDFKIPVPYEINSWIFVCDPINKNITAYALWPNGGVAAPVINEIRGRLHYVGKGDLRDLNGINIDGAILLMDFNSGSNWIKAASLGAKAVIFMEPAETDKYEALSKGSIAPVSFPRLYVNLYSAQILLEAANLGVEVIIHSEMRWKEIEAYNILAELEGANSDDVIILSAHYDSWSVVPSLSPAAGDAIGIAALLEMARCLSNHKPLRTIWFLAYAGYWEGMAGSSTFVEEIILKTKKKVWLQINLDLSDETPYLDALILSPIFGITSGLPMIQQAGAAFASRPDYMLRFVWIEDLFKEILALFPDEKLEKYLSIEAKEKLSLIRYNFESNYWWGTQPDFYMLDSEFLNLAGGAGVTLRTQEARRIRWLSPLNDFKEINWNNVKVNVLTVALLAGGIANIESLKVDWSRIAPGRSKTFGTCHLAYITLDGKVAEFSYEKGWYAPVSGALVMLQIYAPTKYTWPFCFRYSVSDNNGKFKFYGLSPFASWVLEAWKLDDETGEIIYAIDDGFYGRAQGVSGGQSNIAYALGETVSVQIPLFRCISVTIFDLIDLKTMRRIAIPDLRNPLHYFFSESGFSRIEAYDMSTKSLPVFYRGYLSSEGIGVLFLKPNCTYTFTFNPNVRLLSKPIIILSNSSEINPEGAGYLINNSTTITLAMYKSANDIFYIVKSRYQQLNARGIRHPVFEKMLNKSLIYLENANKSLQTFMYEEYYQNVLVALSYLSEAYGAIMSTFDEAAYTIVFFSLLMISFSVFFSEFFNVSGFKKILLTFLIMLILLYVFYFVHPSFSIVANSMMAIIGVGIILLLIFIVSIFIADIRSILEKFSLSRLGFHFFKQEDLAVMIQAFSLSIENMKRRPLLTGLAFITVVLYTASQVGLTSMAPTLIVVRAERGASPYNGLLIKRDYGAPPETFGGVLDEPILDFLAGFVGNKYSLSPRIWLYPRLTYPEGLQLTFISLRENKSKIVVMQPSAVLGMSFEEVEKFNLLIGKWIGFVSDYQCILPYNIASQLNVSIGDKIYILGLDNVFTVSGIMDISAEKPDFDGLSLYPLDPGFSADLSLQPPIYTDMTPFSLPPNNVIIIPWRTALKLGGFISSVALIPQSNVTFEDLERTASDIAYSGFTVYFGYNRRSYSLWRTYTFQFLGWESLSLLLIIASLSISNLMIGSFQMRRKETETYAVIGSSPRGISIMYITESVTFALGGALVGYLVGFALNRVLISTGILPQHFIFNFTSFSVVISMMVLIAAIVLSSLYPSLFFSKLVTPSLERKWRVPTKPKENIWEIRMPLKVDEKEALGVLAYLHEYFTGIGSEQPTFRVINIFGINVDNKTLSLRVLLLPAELNIVHDAFIQGILDVRDYSFYLVMKRISGDSKQWSVRCLPFIDAVRKQLLIWKSLSPKEQAKYLEMSVHVKSQS